MPTDCYNGMLRLLGKHGRWNDCLRQLERMEHAASADEKPSEFSYACVMMACSVGGFPEKALTVHTSLTSYPPV